MDIDNSTNPHAGSDVIASLEPTIDDTPEARRAGKKEALRISLTDAMRKARKRAELTQGEVAERLGVSQSWVSKLESANYDHQVESIVAYLDALGADLTLAIHGEDEVLSIDTESAMSKVTQTLGPL